MAEDNIIQSLKRCCYGDSNACNDCNYDNYPPRICIQHLISDALKLIKKYKEEINNNN